MNTDRTNQMGAGAAVAVAAPLRDEISEALERLSRILVRNGLDPMRLDEAPIDASGDTVAIQEAVRFFGQVAAGWQQLADDAMPEEGAGFGSTVIVEDVDRGGRETYTLMTGALLDIDAGQVSLASPIGQALRGTLPGAVVTVDTPQRQRTLRVVSVCTLRERLDQFA